jgi:hypothetical protein
MSIHRHDKERTNTTVCITNNVLSKGHGLINNIDAKAKSRHLKKLLLRALCDTVYLSEAQNAIPPLYTLYNVYVHKVYLFTQGRGDGGRVEPERRLEGQQFTKLCRKYQHD